ncbi:MAG: hypothetical protein K6G60_02470 [Lachnospiraceae bacterium]|nr:hypothetical protein [Lachnospiraceae bacterium]
MEKTVLKRNILEDLRNWESDSEGPLFLYGIKGVGKAFICREFAEMHENFMYYEPEMSLIRSDLSEDFDPAGYIAEHFGLDPEALASNLLILNETEKAQRFFSELLDFAISQKCKWIFISDYDFTGDLKGLNRLRMFPLRFDEFLINLGYNEWYVSSISENLIRKEKLPDIVHNNLISTFEEYIWTGGMPAVVVEYVREYRLSIRSAQIDSKLCAYSGLNDIKDVTLKTKCTQILDTVDAQLAKSNRKFMFNMIRNGVTYSMYSGAMDELIERGLIIKLEELSDERKFKVYYPEFSFNIPESFDEITDVEFQLREENYILQTLEQKGLNVKFWESGNRAELPFIIEYNNKTIPVDYHGESRKLSKSLLSYRNRNGNDKALIFADSNFVDDHAFVSIPIYAVFCIEKLLEVLV